MEYELVAFFMTGAWVVAMVLLILATVCIKRLQIVVQQWQPQSPLADPSLSLLRLYWRLRKPLPLPAEMPPSDASRPIASTRP